MKKLSILLILPLLAGCISWNQQASLTTKFTNASKSIQDLELSFPNLDAKEVVDAELDQTIQFYYQDEAISQNLKKITSTSQPNFAYKEVINLYFTEGQVSLANLEIHELENGYTKLQNYSFTIQDNQVNKAYSKGELQVIENDPETIPVVSKLNSHMQYINSTYLSS